MRVGLLTSWLSRSGGGVAEAVRSLALALRQYTDLEGAVFGLADPALDADLPGWAGLELHLLPSRGPRAAGLAPGLGAELARADLDVLHVHGLWTWASIVSLAWKRRTGRPLVISPHGMLEPWALHHHGWKKRLALALFERLHLDSADCLHALVSAEAEQIRALGLTNRIEIIPNTVELRPPVIQPPQWASRLPPSTHVLLYLGRLHAKKGLTNLVRAWRIARDAARARSWVLVIAGWGESYHRHELELLVGELDLEDSVLFVGPQHGLDRDRSYHAAAAFILPSISEGLPMAVLEAWASGLPVLMTRACNLPEGFAAGAAIEIASEPAAMAAELLRFVDMPAAERQSMRAAAKRLASEQYSPRVLAHEMASLYASLFGPRSFTADPHPNPPKRSGALLRRLPRVRLPAAPSRYPPTAPATGTTVPDRDSSA
jgi:glycosyltransferase involved in cell wall biosynthesis